MITVADKKKLMNELLGKNVWERLFEKFPYMEKVVLFGPLVRGEKPTDNNAALEILLFPYRPANYIHSKGRKVITSLNEFFSERMPSNISFNIKISNLEMQGMLDGITYARWADQVQSFRLKKVDIGERIIIRQADCDSIVDSEIHFFIVKGDRQVKVAKEYPFYNGLNSYGEVQKIKVEDKPNYTIWIEEDEEPGEYFVGCWDEDNDERVSDLEIGHLPTYEAAEMKLMEYIKANNDINFIRTSDSY